MASIKDYKVNTVENIKKRIDGARAIVLVDYKGINVEQVNKLRTNLRNDKVDYFISKNTWIKIALHQQGITSLDAFLKGTTAVAVSKEDEVAPARVIKRFVEVDLEKDKKHICSFKAGLIGDAVFDKTQLLQLADLPSKEELMAKVLYGFNAPLTGLVGVMSAIIRKFVLVTDAIAKKKAEQN